MKNQALVWCNLGARSSAARISRNSPHIFLPPRGLSLLHMAMINKITLDSKTNRDRALYLYDSLPPQKKKLRGCCWSIQKALEKTSRSKMVQGPTFLKLLLVPKKMFERLAMESNMQSWAMSSAGSTDASFQPRLSPTIFEFIGLESLRNE